VKEAGPVRPYCLSKHYRGIVFILFKPGYLWGFLKGGGLNALVFLRRGGRHLERLEESSMEKFVLRVRLSKNRGGDVISC